MNTGCADEKVANDGTDERFPDPPGKLNVFAPGDKIRAVRGCSNNWPIKAGDTYEVALVVVAGFNHKGPVYGVILDPIPADKWVSSGGQYPYVWDVDRFVFASRSYRGKPTVRYQPGFSDGDSDDTDILEKPSTASDHQQHQTTPELIEGN